MSNSYGIPEHILRQLAEQYLSSQDEQQQQPMLTGEQQNFAGTIPSYDLEGDPQSYTSMLNQLQDVTDLMADPMFQAGGGVGGYSQEAFQPTVTWEQVDSPEYHRWQNYLNTPDSFEGMIAAEIQGGGTPTSALRKIQQRITENPESPVAQQLLMFFPATEEGGIPTGEIDWTQAADAATEIDALRAEIPDIGPGTPVIAPDGTVVPGAGEIVEVDGRLLRRIEEPSELQQKFTELGLPSPYEEYTTESFMPEWTDEPALQAEASWEAARAAMMEADANLRNYVEPAPSAPRPQAEQGGGGGGGGGGPEWGQVAQPYEDYRSPTSPYVVPPIDITEGVPQELEDAFANGTEGQWMAWNWPKLSQHDQTNVREVLTQHNVHPQDFGYELQPEGTGPSQAETVGAPSLSDIPESESGNLPGEAAQTLEGLITSGEGPAIWLAGNYDRLTPQERDEVDAKLQAYGLTASDYGVGGAAPAGQGVGTQPGAQGAGAVATVAGGPVGEALRSMGGGFGGGQAQGLAPGVDLPAAYLRYLQGQEGGEEGPPYEPNTGGMHVTDQGMVSRWDPQAIVLGAQVPRNPPEPTNIDELLGIGGNASFGGQNPWETPPPPQYAGRQEWEAAQPPPPGYPSRQEWEAAQGQAGQGGLTPEEIARIFPQGTGEITTENYGGGPRPLPRLANAMNYPLGREASPEQLQGIFGTPAGPEPISMNYPLGRDVPPDMLAQILGQTDRTPQPPYVYGGGLQYPNRQEWEAAQPGPQYAGRQEWEAAQQPRAEYPSRQEWEAAQPGPQYASRQEWEAAQRPMSEAMVRRLLTGEEGEGETLMEGATRVRGRMRTGEEAGRTEEERRALARERAPRGLTGEQYEPTTSAGRSTFTGRQQRQQVSGLRHRQFRQAFLDMRRAHDETYNYGHGYAMGMAQSLQNRGITPLQQVYAQRMQNILNAGVPLGNQPQVAQY